MMHYQPFYFCSSLLEWCDHHFYSVIIEALWLCWSVNLQLFSTHAHFQKWPRWGAANVVTSQWFSGHLVHLLHMLRKRYPRWNLHDQVQHCEHLHVPLTNPEASLLLARCFLLWKEAWAIRKYHFHQRSQESSQKKFTTWQYWGWGGGWSCAHCWCFWQVTGLRIATHSHYIYYSNNNVYAQFHIGVLPVQTCTVRQLSMGEIVKLREDGKSITAVAQTLAKASMKERP